MATVTVEVEELVGMLGHDAEALGALVTIAERLASKRRRDRDLRHASMRAP